MATIRVDISAENSASREILRLRSEVNNLGEQIAKNNARTASGTAEERRKTAETNRGLRAQQMLLRAQQNRQAIALAGLRQESGLLANVRRQTELLDRETRNAGGGARIFSTAFGELAGTLGAIGITEVAFGIVQAGAAATRASIQVEAATNTFEALGLGAAGAEQRVAELIELSRNPGISFPQAIQAATRLETVGISGERADAVIREFGNSLALVGSTDLSGILLGLEQIVSAGRVTTEEIRQITERSGIAAQAIRDEFGTLIGDDIQQQLDEAGQGVQQFVDRVVAQLETRGRAAVDSTQNSFQNLQNSVFLLGAEIGDRFTPALGAAARGISGFLDGITEGIRGTKDFTQVLADLNAEFVRASGRVELREAIEGGIESLEAFIAQSEEAIRNNSVFFGGREDAILLGQIRQAREELQELQGVQEQNIETEADLRAELVRQEAELERIQQAQTERNNLIAEQGASARRASRIYLENLTEEEIAVIESIEGLEAKIAAYEAAGMAAEEATDTATEGTDDATESTKELTTEVTRLTEVYNGLATNIQQVNELFDFLNQSNPADFYRLARGEIEAYGGAVDTVIPSVTDAEQEQQAFNAAVQSGIDTTKEIVGDPLADYIDGLGLTSEAADGATSAITDNNAATREFTGDIDRASERLRDFQGGVENTKRSHIDFTDVVDRQARPAVEDLTTATDEAAQKAEEADAAFRAIDASLQSVSGSFRITGQSLGDIGDELVEVTEALRDKKISAEEAAEVTEALFQQASLPNNLQREIQNVLDDLQDMEISAEDAEDSVGLLIDAFETFGHDGTLGVNDVIGAFDTLAEVLIDAEGGIGALGTGISGLVDLFSNPISFAAGTLGEVLVGLARLEDFGGPLGLPEGFFDDPTPGSEVIRGGQSLDDARYQDFVDIVLGRRGGYEDPIQFLLDNAPGLIQEFQPRIDTDPRLSSVYNRLFPQQTGPISSFTRSADFDVNAEYAATFEPAQDQATEIVSAGVDDRIEQEQRYLESVTELSERATEARLMADQRLAETQQSIYNSVADAYEDAENRKVDITERAAEQRADADERLADTQQRIYNDVADFYEMTEERKTEISERAAEQRATAEQVYVDTVQGIYNDVADAFETAEEHKTDIAERAAEQRADADERLADTQQRIYNDVADFYEMTEERKTEVSERAAEDRADAEQVYVDTVQGIYNDVADAYEDAENRKVDIAERAAEQRADADERLADTQQRIYNDVADAYEDAEARKVDIAERAAEQRADADERLADTQQDIYRSVVDAFETAEERRADISGRATEGRADADMRYADTVQDIYNDLYLNVVDLQERFNITHADLLQEQSDVEADRLASLEQLHEDHQDRLAEIERDGLQSREDIQREFSRDIEDILRDAGASEELFTSGDFQRLQTLAQIPGGDAFRDAVSGLGLDLSEDDFERVQDIAIQRRRDQEDATLRQQRSVANAQNQLNSRLISVNERAATAQEELTTAIQELTTQLATSITEAEGEAGTTFADAQANFIPAADAMTTALTTLNETIAGINAGETEALAGVDENFDAFVQAAGVDLPTALANAEPPLTRMAQALETHATAIDTINTGEAEAIAGVNETFAEVLETAGVPLTDALNNAVAPMDRWTAALETHATAIDTINTGEAEAIGDVNETFAQVLETAGVPLTDALNNAQEPMTRFAAAGETLATSLDTINTGEASALADLDMGLTDFIGRAGVPLTDALNNAIEPADRWSQALETHAETIEGIDAAELANIAGVNERFADVLEMAGVPLTDALNNAQEPMTRFAAAGETLATSLDSINTGEASALADLDMGLTDFIERAGVPLTDALNNAVEPMDRWTQALETHAETIAGIDADETEALGGVQTFLNDFIERAGVPLTDALANAIEPMDRWTQALETHATAIAGINASELEGIGDAQARNPLAFTEPSGSTQQQTTANMEATTAMTEATTAMTASETAVTEAGTALIQSGVADLFSTAVPTFATAADTFLEGASTFHERVMMAGAGPPQNIENMVVNAQNVTMITSNMSGSVRAEITNPEDVMPDITVELAD